MHVNKSSNLAYVVYLVEKDKIDSAARKQAHIEVAQNNFRALPFVNEP